MKIPREAVACASAMNSAYVAWTKITVLKRTDKRLGIGKEVKNILK